MNGIDLQAFCDTNIAIYLLSGDEHLAELLQGMDTKLSFITELELLSKPNITPGETVKTKAFINQCTVVDISPAIKKKVIEIRLKMKIKLPDAIIAASAITLGLPIITADKQFEKIPGLSAIIVNR
ncbi:MAG: type II toxin-antitoxin system VapC family toxin [Cyclobacteriaceae bacterium]|nr:type II toxin-antitoxin system VapC family toxin [Cyclobacteriaceae bacterium]UYN86201.1 MAG: type II toxin-antitoxin system VapC family toxin [Cyclobacteriaceae bacterium]